MVCPVALAFVALLTLTLVGVLAGSPSIARSQESVDLEANKALAHRFHDDIFEQGTWPPPTRS